MKKGFTIIELLVLIGIVGLLATVVLVAISSSRPIDAKGSGITIVDAGRYQIGQHAVVSTVIQEEEGTYRCFLSSKYKGGGISCIRIER